MLGDTMKIYQERRAKIKLDLFSDPWLLDGVRIFSEDPYNFVRLTNFSYWGISSDEFIRILAEVKEEEKSSNIKAGRFIDLTKTENTEKKTLKTEDEKLKEQQE